MFESSAKDFIEKVILADPPEDDKIVAAELADIRTKFNQNDKTNFVQNVIKLMYLNLSGCNTQFSQIHILSLVANQQYSYKRIGYLAAAILIDMNSDISILLTQELQKDINNENFRIKLCALQFLANCGDQQIFQNLYTDLLPLVESSNQEVAKCAAMCAVRAIKTNKDLATEFSKFVPKLIIKSEHSLQTVAVNLALEIARVAPGEIENWKQVAPKVADELKRLQNGQSTPSEMYLHKFYNDPFLQIKLMNFLELLGEKSTELDDLLTNIITCSDTRRQTAYGILQAAVQCANKCAEKESLHTLAVNELGKVLKSRSPSIIYSVLATLSRILFQSAIYDRESPDSIAVQRYRDTIVQLLDHPDNSIRRRALDVICALVNQSNCTEIVPQMIEFLKNVDTDFRSEMVPKILQVTQSFAPDVMWSFDTQLDIIMRCDGYIPASSITQFTNLVLKKQNIHKHAVNILSNALVAFSDNQTLCQAASFLIGELQEDPEVNDIETLLTIARIPQTTEETLCYVVTAIAKLGNRFNRQEEVGKQLYELGKSNSLEIQQRCGELSRILMKPELRNELLSPLDVEEEIIEEDKSQENIQELFIEKVQEQPKKEEVKSSITPPNGSVEACKTSDYVMFFEIAPAKNQPRIMIRVSTFGLGQRPLTKFHLQFGVPIGWSVRSQAPSGDVLEPLGGKPLVQIIMLECKNRTKLQMKAVAQYMYISQPLKDQLTINPVFEKYGL